MEDKYRSDTGNAARSWVDSVFARDLGTSLSDQPSEESNIRIKKALDDRYDESDDSESKSTVDPQEEEITTDDRRTAWEKARATCAKVQIPAALKLLDRIKPLSEVTAAEFGESHSVKDRSGSIKAQVRSAMENLLEEVSTRANSDVIDSICSSLFNSEPKLIEILASDANLIPRNVMTVEDERSLVDYIALCAHIRSICQFPESEHLESRTGQLLNQLLHNFNCIQPVAKEIREELAIEGVPSDCGPANIPGVKIDDVKQFNATIGRVGSDAKRWVGQIEQHGKLGAVAIRGQVDRIATEIQEYKFDNKKIDSAKRGALLLRQLFSEIEKSTSALDSLLVGSDEEGLYSSDDPKGDTAK